MAATKSPGKASADKTPVARKPRAASTTAESDKKPATRKSAARTTTAGTKTASRGMASAKAAAGVAQMSAEERYRMVEVAAYYIAERDRFAGNPLEYWRQAEAQISGMLGE